MPARSFAALLASALCLAAGAARAWEPADAAAIAARLTEVRAALKDKAPPAAAEEKMTRAKQGKPAWTGKSSFKVEGDGKTYLLGVGLQRAMPDAFGTTMMSEGKAKAGLLGLKGGATQVQSSPGKTTVTTSGRSSAEGVDWWLGPDGTFYALVVEESAPAAPETAPAAPAAAPAAAPK
jgi:hypothetical protein